MRDTALPASRSPSLKPVPGHVLRGGHIFHRRLRRLRAGHLAVPAVHGRHDLHSAHRPPDAGMYDARPRVLSVYRRPTTTS